LLVAGLVALAWQIKRARTEPPKGVESWRADWLDFGIWFWVVCCLALVGVSIFKLLFGDRGKDASDEFGLILRAASMHGAVLIAQLTMLWQRRKWSPWPVNAVNMPLKCIFKEGGLAWLAAIPVVGVASVAWKGILDMVQKAATPVQETVQFLNHASSPPQIGLMIFFAVIVAPINEELFFRAGLYRFLKGRMPTPYALLAINLLFAVAHANLLTFVPLFVLGVLITRLYERTGNIATSMTFHALFNLMNVALILLFPDTAGPLHSP
jgi:membrane protease YdiL (CAAX protease family)